MLKERAIERHEQSLQDVLPLKQQLQRTDDLVVYRVYGLTEEEIWAAEDIYREAQVLWPHAARVNGCVCGAESLHSLRTPLRSVVSRFPVF